VAFGKIEQEMFEDLEDTRAVLELFAVPIPDLYPMKTFEKEFAKKKDGLVFQFTCDVTGQMQTLRQLQALLTEYFVAK
jgi:hypothetical protein